MEIWNYDSSTKELVGSSQARVDPMSPEQYLLPAFATTIRPPEKDEGCTIIFSGGQWIQVEDHRGETWWETYDRSVIIQKIGNPFDIGLNRDRPPAPIPTAEQLCENVDFYRDQRLSAGYSDAVSGKVFQCDPKSISYWNGIGSSALAAITLNVTPEPIYQLITEDNSIIDLPASDALQLLNSRVMPWVSATIHFARTLKDRILAGKPPADIEQGWP